MKQFEMWVQDPKTNRSYKMVVSAKDAYTAKGICEGQGLKVLNHKLIL